MTDPVTFLRSTLLFIIAGVCEIGGGWLMWKWLRNGRPTWWGLAGAAVLVLYGIIPTFQTAHFGRIYAGVGWLLYRAVALVGLGLRREHPGPCGRGGGRYRFGWRLRHDLLAPDGRTVEAGGPR